MGHTKAWPKQTQTIAAQPSMTRWLYHANLSEQGAVLSNGCCEVVVTNQMHHAPPKMAKESLTKLLFSPR